MRQKPHTMSIETNRMPSGQPEAQVKGRTFGCFGFLRMLAGSNVAPAFEWNTQIHAIEQRHGPISSHGNAKHGIERKMHAAWHARTCTYAHEIRDFPGVIPE